MMPDPESGEIKSYVEQLIAATLGGTMKWTQVNPTTYVWDTRVPQPARLSLQRLERQELRPSLGQPIPSIQKVHSFVFQAFESQPGGTLIQRLGIASQENKELNQLLDKLFQTIDQLRTRQSLDFLKNIIPPTKQQ